MSVNKVILVGNLGQDPEIKYTSNNDAICTLSIATSETRKDKQTGEKKQTTEWHRVVFFGDLAEIAGKWLKKGSTVYIEGKLRTRKWQDQQGNDRYTTEILSDTLRMIGGKKEGSDTEESAQSQQPTPTYKNKEEYERAKVEASKNMSSQPQSASFEDDDIPF